MPKRGNPRWGSGLRTLVGPATVTEFECVVRALNLQPHQYAHSKALREWAQKNKNRLYIPEALLNVWRLEPDDEKMHTQPIRAKRESA